MPFPIRVGTVTPASGFSVHLPPVAQPFPPANALVHAERAAKKYSPSD